MPRKARIDAPAALHHIIARGIARKKIFDYDVDRDFFIERLGMIVQESQTQCFAWALIPNHFHLLLKTGATLIGTVMKRLLTGYAIRYNRRHKRYGHLFQNRYKSLRDAAEKMERKYRLKAAGYDLNRLVERVSDLSMIEERLLLTPSKQP
jgi:REP element-mobilizing transposase RayT